MKRILLLFSLITLLATTAHAKIYILVNQPSDKPFPIAVADLHGKRSIGRNITEIIRNDMFISGYFLVVDPVIYEDHARKEGVTLSEMRFGYWNEIEARAIVKGSVEKEKGEYVVELRLFDPTIPQMLVGKKYRGKKKDIREIAHRFSNEIMEALTGRPGVFNTKIAYTARSRKGAKDIFIMDMDGHNSRRITNSKSTNLSPSWSPDGSMIVFTSYLMDKPDLYVIGTDGKGLRQLIGNAGASITPAWSPKGNLIALSSSIRGEADIFLTTPEGKNLKPITNGGLIDIAPTWSPDANEIIFSSERAGGLHLYKTRLTGGAVTRLTFVGYQNDMPAWSPIGDKVAFCGRDLGAFDIFIMNPDGSNIQRLTIASGNNEHPSWSPDGRWIAFSSTRSGGKAIYIMRADGIHQVRVAEGGGELPDWGPK